MPNKNQLVVTKEGGGLTCTTSGMYLLVFWIGSISLTCFETISTYININNAFKLLHGSFYHLVCGICNTTPEGLTIGSPDYPSDYGNDRNCQYYITAPAGMITTISFTTFTVEKDYDHVSVSIKSVFFFL